MRASPDPVTPPTSSWTQSTPVRPPAGDAAANQRTFHALIRVESMTHYSGRGRASRVNAAARRGAVSVSRIAQTAEAGHSRRGHGNGGELDISISPVSSRGASRRRISDTSQQRFRRPLAYSHSDQLLYSGTQYHCRTPCPHRPGRRRKGYSLDVWTNTSSTSYPSQEVIVDFGGQPSSVQRRPQDSWKLAYVIPVARDHGYVRRRRLCRKSGD